VTVCWAAKPIEYTTELRLTGRKNGATPCSLGSTLPGKQGNERGGSPCVAPWIGSIAANHKKANRWMPWNVVSATADPENDSKRKPCHLFFDTG